MAYSHTSPIPEGAVRDSKGDHAMFPRRITAALAAVFGLVVLTPCTSNAAHPFTVEVADGRNLDTGCYSGIAIDALGNPHLVYVDNTTVSPLRHAFKQEGIWRTEVIDPEPRMNCNQLAIDSQGGIHFAYDNQTLHTMKYAVKLGAVVSITTLDTGLTMFANESVITLD